MRAFLKNSSLFILLWIWMSLFTGTTNAQTLYVGSGGTFYVSPGGSLYVNKNISVDGTVSNTGTITLTGDLTVTGTWTSTGTESFSGPGIQTINSAITGTNYLGKVIKNNTGKLFVLGNIDCDSVQWITDGLIDLTSSAIFKIKGGATNSIAGYGSLRHFDVDDNYGAVQRLINILNTNYPVPVGNSIAGYRPIIINESSFGVTGAGFVTVLLDNSFLFGMSYSNYFTTGFSGSYPGICTPGSNPQLYQLNCLDRFGWKLRGPSGHVYTLKTKVPPCYPSSSTNRLVVTQEGTPDFTLNFITSIVGSVTNSLCTYSNFDGGVDTIPGGPYWFWGDIGNAGGDSTIAVLPIELLSLTATGLSESILVQWATASELNNDYFNIQRSTDAKNWFTIGQSDGQGTTNYQSNYFYEDKNVIPNVDYYYRLEQIDFDGKQHYSYVVSASISGGATDVVLFPSLTTGSVHASSTLQQVIVYDLLGKKIREFYDTNDVTIYDVPSGMYLFEITTADGLKKVVKITKQ